MQAITKSQRQDIRALLQSDRVKQQIALVLPKHMTADRMARVAVTAVLKTPKLADCQPESLLQALMLCSQVGLEPDGRNAHLIPYGTAVQVIFDWKGLVALARRNGVQNIASDTVCEADAFEWFRTADGLHFKHVVNWKNPRGNAYAAYCIWKDGDQFDGEVMSRDEIESIRKRSKAGNNGPWVTDWSEMAKKTVVRRASKKWPLDPETAGAFSADDDVLAQTQVRVGPPAPVKPLFAIAAPLTEAEEPQPDAPSDEEPVINYPPSPAPPEPEPDDTDLGQQPAKRQPKAEPEPPKQNYARAIRALLKLGKHTEAELLSLLRSSGRIDDSISSLEEMTILATETTKLVHDEWEEFNRALREAKAAN